MKKPLVALVLCVCSLAAYGQKTRYGQSLPHVKPGVDYPMNVHIVAVHYRGEYIGSGQVEDTIYADALVDGKKLELKGNRGEVSFQHYQLSLGDHRARLLTDRHPNTDSPIFEQYELVLPDQTVWRCTVTGISE